MSIAYKLKVNKRPVGGESPISSEQHLIGISGVFTSTPNRIRLIEVPLKEEPTSSVIIPGYTEVPIDGPAPTSFQFAVDYSLGHIYFNAAQNGNTVFVSYKGRGSEVDSEDVNELEIPLGAALNSDGSLVSGIVHPNNISIISTDDFLFPRDLTITRNLIVNNTISEGDGTLTINTAEVGAPTLNAQFVVARGSSTPVSLRWNETLDAWEFMNNVTPTFQFFNSGAFSLTGPIRIADGAVGAPAYSFTSAPTTGIYLTGTGSTRFSSLGVNVFRTHGGGAEVVTGVLSTPDGTAGAPSHTFSADQTTGIYRLGTSDIAFTTNGVSRLDISTTLLTSQLPISVFTSAGGTSATFTDSTNSTLRIEHPSAGVLAFDVNGGNFFKFTIASTEIARFKSGQALFSGGTFAVPGLSFLTDSFSGLTQPFAHMFGFAIDGFEVARFTPNGDFQLLDGKKVILDGIGNVFLTYDTTSSIYGQTDVSGNFAFGSQQDLTLFSHSVNGEPKISTLGGVINIFNSSVGSATDAARALKINLSQQFTFGYHRTVQVTPSDTLLTEFVLGLGYKADGTDVSAAVISTHNSLPLIVTVEDTEIMQVTSTVVDVKNHKITNVSDPTTDQDAANKRYVDGVAAGLDTKASSIAATTVNLIVTPSGSGVGKLLTATSNGLLTLDGYSTWVDMDNDGGVNDPFSSSVRASRVLVKNQTITSDNGIYAVKAKGDGSHPYILVRAIDFDGSPSNEVTGGDFTFIEQGTSLANTGWVVISASTIVVDTNPINWSQFSAGAIPVVATDPVSPTVGQIWFNTTDNQFKGQNNSITVIIG